jgi:hypothetical protein
MMIVSFGKGIFYRTYSEPYASKLCEFYSNGWISTIKKYLTDDFIAKSNQ